MKHDEELDLALLQLRASTEESADYRAILKAITKLPESEAELMRKLASEVLAEWERE